MSKQNDYPFELEQTCRTCEFNSKGVCSASGELKHGENIADFYKKEHVGQLVWTTIWNAKVKNEPFTTTI